MVTVLSVGVLEVPPEPVATEFGLQPPQPYIDRVRETD